jgi:hypothetical protein
MPGPPPARAHNTHGVVSCSLINTTSAALLTPLLRADVVIELVSILLTRALQLLRSKSGTTTTKAF